eukprot:338892-Chlamydomonas_euryale.AAC.1
MSMRCGMHARIAHLIFDEQCKAAEAAGDATGASAAGDARACRGSGGGEGSDAVKGVRPAAKPSDASAGGDAPR